MSAEDLVLELMKHDNRPYNVQNVADYLQKHKVPKSKVDKALVKLANSGKVTCKEFGKAKVYFIRQDDLPSLTEEEIKERSIENDLLKKQVQEKASIVRELQEESKKYRSRQTLKEMEDFYRSMQKESEVLDSKLAVLRSADTPQISAEDIMKVEKTIKSNLSVWKSRKRSFTDIWGQISENYDGNQRDLFENIGIEGDQEGELLKIEQNVKK